MLEICVFGPITVRTSSAILTADRLGGAKPRQIVEILALAAGEPVSKERLADLLWEGHPPRAYLATLESYVCVLRRTLGLEGGRRSPLATVQHGYVLDPAGVWVDVAEFRRRVREAQAEVGHGATLVRLRSALQLATGDVLPGEDYAAWAIAERDALRLEVAVVASWAAQLALEAGEPDAADLARRAVGADPLAERGWQLLMTALWRSGRRPEALRAFDDLRRHLADELGAAPSRDSEALFVEILRAEDTRELVLDPREEVRLLLGLLRHAVASVPGVRLPAEAQGLASLAAALAATS